MNLAKPHGRLSDSPNRLNNGARRTDFGIGHLLRGAAANLHVRMLTVYGQARVLTSGRSTISG